MLLTSEDGAWPGVGVAMYRCIEVQLRGRGLGQDCLGVIRYR